MDLCGENDPSHGTIIVRAGSGMSPESCVKDGRLNVRVTYPTCVMYFKL